MVTSLVAIFLVAFVGAWGAKKLNQPVLTGYLLAGLGATALLGKFFQFSNTQVLADLGLAFLMFLVGVDFSFARLARVKKIAFVGGSLQMILTTAIIGYLSGSVVLGIVFSLSSTAIVVKILSERGELDSTPSEIIVGWLLVQDLAVVPILTIIPAMIAGGSVSTILTSVGVSLLKAAVLLYAVLIVGKRFVPKILAKISLLGSREVLLITTVGLVLLAASVTNMIGLSFALGAFLAGLLISDGESSHAIFSEIRPLRDVFAVIFFVTLGVMISPSYIFTNALLILKFVLLVIIIKFILTVAITMVFKYHFKTALQVGLSITQVGEFAFVVGSLALKGGLISQNLYSLILTTTIFTMMVTPWQLKLSVSLYENLRTITEKWSPELYKIVFSGFDRYKKEHPDEKFSRHVVICGHGRVGKHITRVLAIGNIPFVVVDYNPNTISDLVACGVPTVFGDPTERDVLGFAGVRESLAVVVAVPDRYSQELIIENSLNLKPGITIICRSHFEEDYRRLYALGATAVVSPEQEAGLSMSHRVLDSLGVDKAKTSAYLKQVRKEQAI
jgi:CPA2 family monovalent cation:H+ antiporter-2